MSDKMTAETLLNHMDHIIENEVCRKCTRSIPCDCCYIGQMQLEARAKINEKGVE